jgi:hypothetical protein
MDAAFGKGIDKVPEVVAVVADREPGEVTPDTALEQVSLDQGVDSRVALALLGWPGLLSGEAGFRQDAPPPV